MSLDRSLSMDLKNPLNVQNFLYCKLCRVRNIITWMMQIPALSLALTNHYIEQLMAREALCASLSVLSVQHLKKNEAPLISLTGSLSMWCVYSSRSAERVKYGPVGIICWLYNHSPAHGCWLGGYSTPARRIYLPGANSIEAGFKTGDETGAISLWT